MEYVSFPGFHIGPFHMDPVAFSIGPISVRWYGIIITCGMILAVLFGLYHAKHEKVKSDDILDFALCLILCGIVGARLYYVVMRFREAFLATGGTFLQNVWNTFYNVIAVWDGGLAIYGGIIGGFIGALVMARKKHIRFPVIADIAGPSVMIGQIVGRWGNFVNVEAYGSETTLPWRMGIHYSVDGGVTMLSEKFVHPTFLYESLWNLLGLILLSAFYKKKKYHGQVFLLYMTWYGFGRMLIESLRTDSLYIGSMRVSQFVGFATFVVGLVLLIGNSVRHRKKQATHSEYTPVYAAASGENHAAEVPQNTEIAETKENAETKETDDGKID